MKEYEKNILSLIMYKPSVYQRGHSLCVSGEQAALTDSTIHRFCFLT